MRFIIFISSSIILISGGILLIVYTGGWYFGGWYGGLMLIFFGVSVLASLILSVIWDEKAEVILGSFFFLINCPIILIAGGIRGMLHGGDPYEGTAYIFSGLFMWGLFIPLLISRFRRGKNKRKDGTSGRNDWELSEKNDRNQ
ncbi:hypothetical protein QUF80_11655 [Desulfococcaceae bacterium HSG8]|nr:hypothetical protein [Desulfococcaceae bacterium HSG8]